jgi:hypothetical protein
MWGVSCAGGPTILLSAYHPQLEQNYQHFTYYKKTR